MELHENIFGLVAQAALINILVDKFRERADEIGIDPETDLILYNIEHALEGLTEKLSELKNIA